MNESEPTQNRAEGSDTPLTSPVPEEENVKPRRTTRSRKTSTGETPSASPRKRSSRASKSTGQDSDSPPENQPSSREITSSEERPSSPVPASEQFLPDSDQDKRQSKQTDLEPEKSPSSSTGTGENSSGEATLRSAEDVGENDLPGEDTTRDDPEAGNRAHTHFSHQERKAFKKNKKRKNKGGGGFFADKERNGPPPWKQPPPPSERPPVFGNLPQHTRFPSIEECRTKANGFQAGLESIDLHELYHLSFHEIKSKAVNMGLLESELGNRSKMLRSIVQKAGEEGRAIRDRGFLELLDDGSGFIVHEKNNYRVTPESTYIAPLFSREYAMRRGQSIAVIAQAPLEEERGPSALCIEELMERDPGESAKLPVFEDLIPYYPLERIYLEVPGSEHQKKDVSMRAVDILTPIGLGQRGLIVAPPRTGKTILLQGMANSIRHNHPEAHLILLLIDERPEEVTDFRRHVNAEIISSTFDESPVNHVHVAEMVLEKARRMVEASRHVVILLDSITRLARAYNALAANSGKIMSGGIEATALQKPKRFFGSARNIEGSGSLTIMGTALVDTGSKMDEVIFEEFKGTGNMELHLDRDLVNKRIFPALNFERSGTRKEELLYHPDEISRVYGLRRVMQGVPPVEAMEMLISRLKKTKTNAEFLMSLNR